MPLFNDALEHHQAGRLEAARAAYLELIGSEPNHSAALANLGVLLLQRSRPGSADFEQGIAFLRRSLASNEQQPYAHNNLANALAASGDFEASDQHYLAAIEYSPKYLEAYINRALLLKRFQGNVAAKSWLCRFEALFSAEVGFWMCLGALRQDTGAYSEALESFDKVISLNPNAAEAWYNRGNALRLLRRTDEALVSYRRCLRLNPMFAEALTNMGVIQQDRKHFDDAVSCYEAALKINPVAVNAHYNRALALENIGRFEEAVIGYADCLNLSPAYPYLVGRMQHARMQMCDWNGYEDHVSAISAAVGAGLPTLVPFPFLAVADDLDAQQQCATTYVQDKFPAGMANFAFKQKGADTRIRVGYFSSDLRTHAVGFLTAGLFEAHDRNAFEVFAISLGTAPEADPYRQRIANAVEHFIEASTMADTKVIDLVRSLELDIAIDLAGHTMDARTAIFAQRVAPIQVSYLGYPGSMGASYMDAILADETVIPRAAEPFYTERVVRLPQTFQINDDKRLIGQAFERSHYRLPERGLVFASFNTSYKINPPIFDIWCRFLQRAPESVLWLFGENETQIRNLRREAASRGIEPERLVFASRIPYADHLARYVHVDLVLDTLPFNGGTSTSDALWGGAPVLTCMGASFAARMSASLLQAVGLPELVTESLDRYEAFGHELINDVKKLSEFKERLRAHRLKAPLFDTESQTRAIENAYREMLSWRTSDSINVLPKADAS